LFATPKAEIGTRVWATREQARRDIVAYLSNATETVYIRH
jgi:hypothetical protein